MLGAGTTVASRFRILEQIARGGMGTVYKAEQLDMGRTVALKVLQRRLLGDKGLLRFRREAQVLSAIQHRNINKIYAFGTTEEGDPFLALEYLHGETLASLLKRAGSLSWRQTFEIGEQLCAGMSEAHANDIVHRDLKPDNIFVESDGSKQVIKIADFGLAKLLAGEEAQKLTETGYTVGTTLYMSPEQLCGDPVTPASDIYALGCILFECLTGHSPLYESGTQTTHKRLAEDTTVVSIAEDAPGPTIARLLSTSLKRRTCDRFESMAEMRTFIEQKLLNQGVLNDAPIALKIAGQTAKDKQQDRVLLRNPVKLAVAGALTVLTTATAFWWTQHSRLPDANETVAAGGVKSKPALQLEQDGDYAAAIEQYKKDIKHDRSREIDLRFRLTNCYICMEPKRLPEALQELNLIVSKGNPFEQEKAHTLAGDLCLQCSPSRIDESIHHYDHITHSANKLSSLGGRYNLGLQLLEKHRYKEAERQFKVVADSGHSTTALNAAIQLCRLHADDHGNRTDVLRYLKIVEDSKVQPLASQARWDRLDIVCSSSSKDKSMQAWEKVAQGDRDDTALTAHNRISSLFKAMTPAERNATLERVLAASRSKNKEVSFVAKMELGRFYDDLQRYDLAAQYFSQAVTNAQTRLDVSAHIWAADEYGRMMPQRLQQAIFHLNEAAKCKWEPLLCATSLRQLNIYEANSVKNRAEIDRVIAVLNRLADKSDTATNITVHTRLAQAYQQRKKLAEAAFHAKKAVELASTQAPRFEQYLANAQLYQQLTPIYAKESLQELDKADLLAISLDQKNAVLEHRAEVYARLPVPDYDKAIQLLETVLEAGGTHQITAHSRLGDFYQYRQPANVRKSLEHLLEARRLWDERNGNPPELSTSSCATVEIQTGNAYLNLGELEQARTHFERAVATAELGDLRALGLGGLGRTCTYRKPQQLAKAVQYIEKAIAEATTPRTKGGQYLILAEIYQMMKPANKKRAAECIRRAAELGVTSERSS